MRDEMKCLECGMKENGLKVEVGRLKVKDLGFWVEGGEWRVEV